MRTPSAATPRAVLALVGFVAVAPSVACRGALRDGEAEFAKGQYPQAKQTLAAIENESLGWNEAKRAEFALYRGLTFAALGDRSRAAAWLHEAKVVQDEHPGALGYDDVRRLAIATDAVAFP